MSTSAEPTTPGLRERKKARTRAAIREHAFRLFREQGYDATTVEQIAEAAEVSPSTFFRYFPTKEDVVLQDDLDVLWLEAVRAQPPELSPLAAMRTAMVGAYTSISPDQIELLRESTQLALDIPAVRARTMEELAKTISIISGAIGERCGRPADDFAVRTLAGAVVGVATAALFAAGGDLEVFFQKFSDGLELLDEGLPL
jgi:AcrR family transcriptional regulator